jgi:MATE family multidrug resistance protein
LADIRVMLRIALPLALAELGWMAMGVVDTIMVGRLPDSALAIGATSVGGALFYGVAVFGLGLMSGLDTLVSQAYGAGDMPEARRAMRSGLILAAGFALPLVALVLGLAPLLAVIGVEAAVVRQATGFVQVLVWSMPLLLLYSVVRRYLQGIHYVRPVTWALVSSNLINAGGNWFLIYGRLGAPRMGIRGSAFSTLISRIYLAAFLVVAVRKRDPQAFHAPRVQAAHLSRLFRLGLPAAFAIGFEVWVFNLVTALVATLDPISLAAHTIALNAASVTYMVPLGISSAAAVSVGRAWGAGDPREAARSGWHAICLAAGFEIFSAFAFLLFPSQIARIYTADAQIVATSIRLLAIAAAFQMFDGLQATAAGALRGLADTRTPMVVTLVAYWVVGLPLGCWLCYRAHWGVFGIWWGLCLSLFLIAGSLLPVWARKASSAQPDIVPAASRSA